MQESNKLHILKKMLLYSCTHVEHFELEHQSVDREKNEILNTWNASSTKMSILGCSG